LGHFGHLSKFLSHLAEFQCSFELPKKLPETFSLQTVALASDEHLWHVLRAVPLAFEFPSGRLFAAELGASSALWAPICATK